MSDSASTTTRTITFTVNNTAPTLDPIADQAGTNETPLTVALALKDPDLDAAFRPYLVSIDNPLFLAKSSYGLTRYHSEYEDYAGMGEKYVGSYMLLPGGKLYSRNGGMPGTGTLVATLGDAAYADPNAIVNSTGTASEVVGSFAGGNLVLTYNAGYAGTVRVTVRVSDGAASASRTFDNTVAGESGTA